MAYIGPTLPPHLAKKIVIGPVIPGQDEESRENEEEEEQPPFVIGPIIPQALLNPVKYFDEEIKEKDEKQHEEEEEEGEDVGRCYGPTLPSNFEPCAGPSLPPGYDSDEEDIGPRPIAKGTEEQEELQRLYRIAVAREAEEQEKNAQPKREEWMTSVPKTLGNIGLGARTFKKGTAVERDSTWEDVPGAKKRKAEEKLVIAPGIAESDARQAAIVEEKAAGPTLVEMYQKKRREEAPEAYNPNTRRPFDREKDMEVRGLKPGASKEAVDRLKEFASRFSNSKTQRFL
ncbi:unnamed protein product [Caenorhabditis bovis]|uniref:DUF3752 domain-containing protein n=1 Tax=Caenorhabditis bovis TaxID=2654633 RepID=A0A8S1F5V7_9PELO|nr:unnamed protein product [Caenorhabditis bovis]